MKLTYWIRNKRTMEATTRVEATIQDKVVIEAIKDHLPAPTNCDMENDFEYHDICIDTS